MVLFVTMIGRNHYTHLLARANRVRRQLLPTKRHAESVKQILQSNLYDRIWNHAVQSLGGSIRRLHGGFCEIIVNNHKTYVRGAGVCLDNHLALRMAGNKVLVYKLLEESGLTTPPKYCAFSISDVAPAFAFFRDSCDRAVVKPAAGTGAGAGVISNIATERVLAKAIIQAGSYCNDLLIDEHICGKSYRLLYLGGELIDAIERQPPIVVGNGKDNILRLVRIENELRAEAEGSRATSLIDVDLEMHNCLELQGQTLQAIPASGQAVRLKNVVNQNNAMTNVRVFDSVHPAFRELGGKVAKLLSLELIGVDIIATDIASPASEQIFVINDINTAPGLHHHYLLSGGSENHDVAVQILQYIFR